MTMSNKLDVLVARRDEMMEAIHLLEVRSHSRSGLALSDLIGRLRLKVEWLNKRIQMESERRFTNAA